MGGEGSQFRPTSNFQDDNGVPNGKQFVRPPTYSKFLFTGSARGSQALEDWEQFRNNVDIVMSQTTVINKWTGRFEWMIQHRALCSHYIVLSGQAFEHPVQVSSQIGPLHRVIMYANGQLSERMNHLNPAMLNITAQQFTTEDQNYSDMIFAQILATAEEDLEYSPMCDNAQSRIYMMLQDMTQKGSPANQLISHIQTGKGSLAWHHLCKEFSCQRPTEKLSLITAFQQEPKQHPGQSVQSYILECQKFYGRLSTIASDPKKRWEMLMASAVMRGVRPNLKGAVERFSEECALISAQKGIMPEFNMNTVQQYLQQAQDAQRFNDAQEAGSSRRMPGLKAFNASEDCGTDDEQPDPPSQANLADINENQLQEMIGTCSPDVADALLAMAGVICYWCGKQGHVVKECTTKCPDCGASPSTLPGTRSEHKPGCSQATFIKNKQDSRGSRAPGKPKQSNSKRKGYDSWKKLQPNSARNFRRAYAKARIVKPGRRDDTQKGICLMAESLGLNEDDDLTDDGEGDDDDLDPEDSAWLTETSAQDHSCVLGNNNHLTWVHPACHAIGGASNPSGSTSNTVKDNLGSVASARADQGNLAVIQLEMTGTGQVSDVFAATESPRASTSTEHTAREPDDNLRDVDGRISGTAPSTPISAKIPIQCPATPEKDPNESARESTDLGAVGSDKEVVTATVQSKGKTKAQPEQKNSGKLYPREIFPLHNLPQPAKIPTNIVDEFQAAVESVWTTTKHTCQSYIIAKLSLRKI